MIGIAIAVIGIINLLLLMTLLITSVIYHSDSEESLFNIEIKLLDIQKELEILRGIR